MSEQTNDDYVAPRFNLTVPPKMMEEWKAFAEREGMSVAQLVRSAVVEMIRRREKATTEDPKIAVLEEKLRQIERGPLMVQSLAIQDEQPQVTGERRANVAPPPAPQGDFSKAQIDQVVDLLFGHSEGLQTGVIASNLDLDRAKTMTLLAKIASTNAIVLENNLWKIRMGGNASGDDND